MGILALIGAHLEVVQGRLLVCRIDQIFRKLSLRALFNPLFLLSNKSPTK